MASEGILVQVHPEVFLFKYIRVFLNSSGIRKYSYSNTLVGILIRIEFD